MKTRAQIATAFLVLTCASAAEAAGDGKCETSASRKTTHGIIALVECGNATVGRQATLLFDNVPVLTSAQLSKEDGDDERGLFIFSREANALTACPDRLFLVDASQRPVRVVGFGVRGACNLFDSAKWSRDRAIITLKKGVDFIYAHGTLIPPKASTKLWNAIEPPHTGEGLAQADAIPFVEAVAPSKASTDMGRN